MARQDWIRYIRQNAPRYGLDPAAVLAVASAEGLSGGVGDAGTSFGPFQLHVGGALPRGRGRAWAESPAGLDYALAQIGGVAKGLRGRAAVQNIVRRFERPADPTGEIARAWGAYGGFADQSLGSAVASSVVPGAPPARGGGRPPAYKPGPPRYRTERFFDPGNLAQGIFSSLAAGGTPDVNALVQGSWGTRQVPIPQAPPLPSPPGRTPLPRPPAGAPGLPPMRPGLVKMAAKQLGQPYVWGAESRAEGGFDCSGLIDWAARQRGYKGARLTTWNLATMGQSVKGKQLRPGDLVISNNGQHVTIYAGNGKVLASPHTGAVVQWQSIPGNVTDVRRVNL